MIQERHPSSPPLFCPSIPLQMTISTALMPVRSRSSLRVSARRDPPDRDHDNKNLVHQPPPPKRPRLSHPPPSRRRKSSPDLLDTTIEDSNTPKPPPPSTRRPRPHFPSSAHTTASPPPQSSSSATPRARSLRFHHHDSPASTSTALYLNGNPGRESPDPLDTISPAPPARATPKSVRKPSPHTNTAFLSSSAGASHAPRRRVSQAQAQAQLKASDPREDPEEDPARSQSTRSSSSRRPVGATAPQPQSTTAPLVGTASNAVPDKRRSLRSHDGGLRARSELALYFPNYEEILSLEPPKTEFLGGHTVIKLVDDLSESPILSSKDSSAPDANAHVDANADVNADTPFGNPLVNLHRCEVITLPEPCEPIDEPGSKRDEQERNEEEGREEEDPLNEEVYFRAHRRHERQEKQLRNIERDRAQHEKQQLDRLLDELQGNDWLRVMGITGLTDQDKKLYEPKRDYFIKEISALLQKFKIWKEEEKRRKLEKDKSSTSFSHPDAAEHPSQAKDSNNADETILGTATNIPGDTTDQTPDINDVDALAARQLLQEARSATTTAGKKPKPSPAEGSSSGGKAGRKKPPPTAAAAGGKPDTQSQFQSLHPPPEPDRPFTSFFSKPHLREMALSGKRKGRTRLAFGHPVPDLEEREFELPADILTPEAIKDCQRKRRRMRRASLE